MKDRDQEIKDKALDKYGDSDSACAYCQRMGFKAGAKWADENPVIWPTNDKLTRDASWYYNQAITQQELLFKSKEELSKSQHALSIAKEALMSVKKCEQEFVFQHCAGVEGALDKLSKALTEIQKLENEE